MQSIIRNRKQVRQVIDFTGVGDEIMHPTDIDAVFEFDNKCLILMEVKKYNAKLSIGQKLVLERITDSWHTNKSISLIVQHNCGNDDVNIPLRDCICVGYYYQKAWWKLQIPLLTLLKKIFNAWEIKKIKL